MNPYYSADGVQLFHGDMRDVLPALGVHADLIIADPPYEQTALRWDRWPGGWLHTAAQAAASLWCFLPLREFAGPRQRGTEFADAGWKLSQEIVWEKHNGSGFAADRFKRVHELATHWYRGRWKDIHHNTPTMPGQARPNATVTNREGPPHTGHIGPGSYEYGATRIARSVLRVPSMHGRAIHPTEKPVELLTPMIGYGCPPGALVIDPFAGSGSTGVAARLTGRRALLIDSDERYCEAAATRLAATAGQARPAAPPG